MARNNRRNNRHPPNDALKPTNLSSAPIPQGLPPYENRQTSEQTSNGHHEDVSIGYNKKWNKSEVISAFSLCVNIVLATLTYSLYKIATTQSKIASDAVSISQSTFIEAQKNFKISNAPYLQVEFAKLSQFIIDKPVNIDFIIRNLGVYPAKISKMNIGVSTTEKVPDFFIDDKKSGFEIGNTYITKDQPVGTPIYGIIPNLDKETYNKLVNGNWILYVEGSIEYYNLVDNGKRKYKFIIGISIKTKQLFSYPLNDNIDIK